eukprot:TRINITY_DN9328_c0_g1_i1.p1 TRINITY_DN9328_c0_g1~~TRINITY_DN9328_c0_g1_i1.p1  ORF type:complete len:749 (+),score=198.73 TRINITY_DN9328_c0_g1_i1:254-2500(+)
MDHRIERVVLPYGDDDVQQLTPPLMGQELNESDGSWFLSEGLGQMEPLHELATAFLDTFGFDGRSDQDGGGALSSKPLTAGSGEVSFGKHNVAVLPDMFSGVDLPPVADAATFIFGAGGGDVVDNSGGSDLSHIANMSYMDGFTTGHDSNSDLSPSSSMISSAPSSPFSKSSSAGETFEFGLSGSTRDPFEMSLEETHGSGGVEVVDDPLSMSSSSYTDINMDTTHGSGDNTNNGNATNTTIMNPVHALPTSFPQQQPPPPPSSPPPDDTLPFRLEILGVPERSRVEKQMKMCLRITRNDGGKAAFPYTHLRLPNILLTQDRIKSYLPAGTKGTVDEGKILDLDVKVLLSSTYDASSSPSTPKAASASSSSSKSASAVTLVGDHYRQAYRCYNCIHRERNTAQRKKRRLQEQQKKLPASKQSTNKTEDSDVMSTEDEKLRIVQFYTTSEIVAFVSGEVVIPLRVTCYPRHHQEKDGFRLFLSLVGNEAAGGDGVQRPLASGLSSVFVICDDHKSTTRQRKRKLPQSGGSGGGGGARGGVVIKKEPEHDAGAGAGNAGIALNAHTGEAASGPSPRPLLLPYIERIIPGDGPATGGIEVSILGRGFTEGTTVVFDTTVACRTQSIGDSAFVVLLPPAPAGSQLPATVPVRVGNLPRDDANLQNMHVEFHYRDDTDRQLLELALQVIGEQLTGVLSNPRDIAMAIVNGGATGSNGGSGIGSSGGSSCRVSYTRGKRQREGETCRVWCTASG